MGSVFLCLSNEPPKNHILDEYLRGQPALVSARAWREGAKTCTLDAPATSEHPK